MPSFLLSGLRLFVVVFLQVFSVSGFNCTLPEPNSNEVEDYIRICGMCSDTDAAVRWTIREDVKYDVLIMTYECSVENGTIVHSLENDECFDAYPGVIHTGTTGVGHQLTTGLVCKFRAGYRAQAKTIVKMTNCTVKSPEVCAEDPEECTIDRISEVNVDGECEVQCAAGFTGHLCNNIDECKATNTCDTNADCIDTDGSYWCQCLPGFTGDGFICTNINECAGNHTCSTNADCIDTDGSYWCQCLSGFTGDGYICTDINECENVTCGENGECINTEGNYSCQCKSGFTGDGYYCTDTDECVEERHNCTSGSSYCINTVGSYECVPKTRKTDDVVLVAVLVPIVLLISVILPVTLILISLHRIMKREKKPAFHELTKMDLDPYYTPTFWNGSLLSIRSLYEKLIFADSVTDINSTQDREQDYGTSGYHRKPPTPVLEKVDDDPNVCVETLHRETETNGQSTPHSDYVSHASASLARQQEKEITSNSTRGFDSRAVSSPDSLVSPTRKGDNNPSPKAMISCVNYTFDEVPLPDIALPSPVRTEVHHTETQTMGGYVLETVGSHNTNRHKVTSWNNAKSRETLDIDHRGHDMGSTTIIKENDDYIESSTLFGREGHQMESVDTETSGIDFQLILDGSNDIQEGAKDTKNLQKWSHDPQGQNDFQTQKEWLNHPQEFITSQVGPIPEAHVGTRGKEEPNIVMDYIPSSAGSSSSSSGYSTAGEMASSGSTGDGGHTLSSWHSEVSLESCNIDNMVTTTTEDLAKHNNDDTDAGLDSIKFTLNARQEFEYVNAMEERFLSDVKFEILLQDK